jgi:GMP synthase (glutamine-hydrolysing)
MFDEKRKMAALQFHPEVVHTPEGKKILANFVYGIAGCEGDWTPGNFIEQSIKKISTQVGDEGQAICALSGGVDSTVAAVLVAKALKDRLYCFFVDTGLGRKNEAVTVMQRLKALNLNVELVDARERFFAGLRGVTDPEQKRKIIGRIFIEVFEERAKAISSATHLVQGTLYPDVIESVSVKGPSATIKTHHNVGGLPEGL